MKKRLYDFIMNDWVLSFVFASELVLGIFFLG